MFNIDCSPFFIKTNNACQSKESNAVCRFSLFEQWYWYSVIGQSFDCLIRVILLMLFVLFWININDEHRAKESKTNHNNWAELLNVVAWVWHTGVIYCGWCCMLSFVLSNLSIMWIFNVIGQPFDCSMRVLMPTELFLFYNCSILCIKMPHFQYFDLVFVEYLASQH